MSTIRTRRPSAALVISVLALIMALGGTSYAAFSLPNNSVGTKQLRKGSVTTTKIKNRSVTKAKLNMRGLTVPNAMHAHSAELAQIAASAQEATSATFSEKATHAVTADSANAIAYGHVLPDGALDGEHSKNVVLATKPATGVYCMKVSVPVAGAAVTNDFAATGRFGTASAVLAGQDGPNLISAQCPAGDNVLVATAAADTGTAADRGFWVTFN
jgi:hypothetical protein